MPEPDKEPYVPSNYLRTLPPKEILSLVGECEDCILLCCGWGVLQHIVGGEMEGAIPKPSFFDKDVSSY